MSRLLRKLPEEEAKDAPAHFYECGHRMVQKVPVAPYELMFRGDFHIIRCQNCRATVSTEQRYYRNLETRDNTPLFEVRSPCACLPAAIDPYLQFAKPEPVWDSPGSIEGEMLYPSWDGERWVMQKR